MPVIEYIKSKHNLIIKLVIVFIVSIILTWVMPSGLEAAGFITQKNPAIDKNTGVNETPRKENKIIFVRNDAGIREKKYLVDSLRSIYQHQVDLNFLDWIDSLNSNGLIESANTGAENVYYLDSDGKNIPLNMDNYHTITSIKPYLKSRSEKVSASLKDNVYDLVCLTYILSKSDDKDLRPSEITGYGTNGQVQSSGSDYGNDVRVLSRFGFTFILCMILFLYLYYFRKNIFGQNKEVAFLFILLMLSVQGTFLLKSLHISVYAAPIVLVPVIVRSFFDSRTALFTHLIVVLLCSFYVSEVLMFISIQIITAMGVLFSVSAMKKRQQIVNASFIAVLVSIFTYVLYSIAFKTNIDLKSLDQYRPFVISGVSVIFSIPIIYGIERMFGFTSDFKLLELCDLNQPLLRKLSQEVPGTFQHSLQVANLAEEAIYYIGGNSLLTRAGAMYHDIGKMAHPEYFIENQGGQSNPHESILPKESAKIIIDHIIEGIELGRKHKLPDYILDFIRTHHGTTTVRFFLNLQQKESILEVDESEFRYPGPIPFSKETAVVMLADAVEAASRSLKQHDALTLNDLVDKIVQFKIDQNQLLNADITFKEISQIKKVFKKRLITIHHARIEYPS